MIDRETQQKIKDAANIIEVVGDYVKLTRRGANYMGLCPFHNERTPSFSVSPRKNFCHCFSCKKGGSPVNFLMEKEGISYTEALLLLAKKYNIPVQERELSDEERRRMSEREAMLVASEWAMNHFHDNLYNTEEGRTVGLAYLYGRGITDEAIRKFKLGYSLDSGDALITRARNEGFDIEVLKNAGLVGTSAQGRNYDKFRGRVMFPIRNTSGKPVAFGGRALRGEPAKYINSQETLIYRKSNELYGIFEAKAEAVRLDRMFLMEGYLDVIGSWQGGIRNAVASSGTALTESQIALIHRFTDNVTLIYDGDAAGIKASLRGIDMLLAQSLHVKVLFLPDGDDPDSFAAKHTPEEFMDYIEAHQTDFIRYKLGVLLKDAGGNPQEISEAVRSVVSSIASIPDEIERISYIKECARMVDIDEKVISRQVSQAIVALEGATRRREQLQSQDFRSSVVIPVTAAKPQSKPTPQAPQTAGGDTGNRSEGDGVPPDGRFYRQEEEILKYCVRYAYLPMEIDGEEMMVVDYVAEELQADGISFTHPVYLKVFELLMRRKEAFGIEFARHKEEVEARLDHDRAQFRDVLRAAGGTMAKIKAEEDRFAKEEELRRREMLRQFAVGFSVDAVINHEDRDIREAGNPLVAERHTLSTIYTRQGGETLMEEDKLGDLVPRALSELRSEILNTQVEEIQARVLDAIGRNDPEAQMELMGRLSKLLYIRSRIAENLGERIISPR